MQSASPTVLELMGPWLGELEKESSSIEKEEVRLMADGLKGMEHDRQMHILMARANVCFRKIHAIRQKLQEFCSHEGKVMVVPGGSWYCLLCEKVHYEAPVSRL